MKISIERIIVHQALEEEDSERAMALFKAARSIRESSLQAKIRMSKLADGITTFESLLAPDGPLHTDEPACAETKLPHPWRNESEPLGVRYLRSIAELPIDAGTKAQAIELADNMGALEFRYASLWKLIQRELGRNPMTEDNEVLDQVQRQRISCYCCGMGCHICDNCQPYLHWDADICRIAQLMADPGTPQKNG